MFKKKDILIILVLVLLLAAAVFFWIYNRQSFTVGDTNALIDNRTRVIFVSLPEGSSPQQKISFKFPLKNYSIYIKNLSSGSSICENPEEKKLESGKIYDFGSFISHCKLIIKSGQSSIEYDMWVTTGDIPILAIEAGSDIPDEPKIDCTIKILSQQSSYNTAGIASEIELVDISEDIPRNSYSFNLRENQTTGDIPQILDFEISKRFRLSALYSDRSFLRQKLAWDIFQSLSDDNIAPDSRYVELYLNGNYQGVYLLSRRVDRNMFPIANYSKKDSVHSVIYEAANRKADFSNAVDGFSQIEPDYENDGPYTNPLMELIDFITLTDKDDFLEKVDDILDMDNLIDNHILFLISGSTNELASNQYIYRGNENGDKFKFCPGDHYSSGFGRDKNSLKIDSTAVFYGTRLYNRLYEDEAYREKLKTRWNTLRQNIITADNIYSLIDKNAMLLSEAQYRNFSLCPITIDIYGDKSSFSEDIKCMKEFIEERINWLDNYINYPPLIKIGEKYAFIDEETGTIFCALPGETNTSQKITWDFKPDTSIYIEPVSRGKYNTYQKNYEEYKDIFTNGTRKDNAFMFIDTPQINEKHPEKNKQKEKIILKGWALDPQNKDGTGVEKIFVFDGPGQSKRNFLGEASYKISRPDVADYFDSPNYEYSGFELIINTFYLGNGPHELYIYAYDTGGNYSLKILPIEIRNKNNIPAEINDHEIIELGKGEVFDFGDYIFHGILTIENSDSIKDYDFWVTNDRLPIVYIDTDNVNINNQNRINASMKIIYYDTDEKNFINSTVFNYAGNIVIRIRGKSSLGYPKKQYSIELREEDGLTNNNVSILDMPKENDWVLYAPYGDKTLIRNVLAFELSNQIGSYAARTRFVEVFLSEKEDLIIEGGYNGLYVLMEKIKRDKNRVNIEKLEPGDKDISGGYILEMEAYRRFHPWDSYFRTNRGLEIIKIYPDGERIRASQEKWITDYINRFESVLYSDNFKDVNEGYRKYIDVDSFIDYIILNELFKNADIFYASTFMYKDKGEKLKLGPVWDFNASSGNVSPNIESSINRPIDFAYLNKRWTERLFQDKYFVNKYIARWKELRKSVISDNNIKIIIKNSTTELSKAPDRNFEKWQILGKGVWPNPEPYAKTYDEEIDNLIKWFFTRTEWIDKNIDSLLTYHYGSSQE